jgi:hypothetical protein
MHDLPALDATHLETISSRLSLVVSLLLKAPTKRCKDPFISLSFMVGVCCVIPLSRFIVAKLQEAPMFYFG